MKILLIFNLKMFNLKQMMMKKISTFKKILSLIAGLMMVVAVNAQQTVTKTIAAEGGDYTTVYDALKAVCAATASPLLVAGDNVILNVVGTVTEPTTPVKFLNVKSGSANITVTVPLNILIQGKGPGESAISGTYPAGADGKMWQVNGYDEAGVGTFGGTKITFKDLTMKNFGSKTLSSSGGAGAVILMTLTAQKTCATVFWKFQNVVFTECGGKSLFQIAYPHHDVIFDNCLFKNNNLFPSTDATGNGPNALIYRISGGNLTVKNCTFANNTFKPLVDAGTIGSLINIVPAALQNTNLVFENNQASNNLFDASASVALQQAMFGINTNITPGEINYTIKNNVFIGNRRAGTNLDTDFYFQNLATTPFTASGNIVNEVLERLGDGLTIPPYTYPRITSAGFDISPDYTYASPKVNYLMEGALPKLVEDENKIGHFVKGTGTGIRNTESGNLSAYFNKSTGIQLNGQVSKTADAILYDIHGRVVKTSQLKEGNSNSISTAGIKSGIYLLKVKDQSRIQTIKLTIN
jgi:hypothetical protein